MKDPAVVHIGSLASYILVVPAAAFASREVEGRISVIQISWDALNYAVDVVLDIAGFQAVDIAGFQVVDIAVLQVADIVVLQMVVAVDNNRVVGFAAAVVVAAVVVETVVDVDDIAVPVLTIALVFAYSRMDLSMNPDYLDYALSIFSRFLYRVPVWNCFLQVYGHSCLQENYLKTEKRLFEIVSYN